MSSLFLTAEEIVVLNGRRAPKQQVEALTAMGVNFLVNALGRVVVTRNAVEGAQSAEAPTPLTPSRAAKAY